MKDEGDNVIHVSFGRDGSHRRVAPSGPEPATPAPQDHRSDDPLADLYSEDDVARLFGLPVRSLRKWTKKGFITASIVRGRRSFYTFQDLIGIRAAKGLIEAGVPERVVEKSVDALRGSLPKVVRPLTEMRVIADGHTVVVQDEAGAFEPTTGQRVLDFSVDTLKDDVVRVLRPAPSDVDRRAAYQRYLEGCRLDEDEATLDLAEEAYVSALKLDPSLACALTNLGNLSYRRGQTERAHGYYLRALTLDAEQPEAHYNLGFLELESARARDAVPHFERALASDPSFADAHFNLAMAYEELGSPESAKPHWTAYLELEPEGAWSEIARRHLAALAR